MNNRDFLIKYTYCDIKDIEKELRILFNTALSDEDIDTLCNKFKKYIMPFFETGGEDYILRKIFNVLRSTFMCLTIRLIDNFGKISYWRLWEYDNMFANMKKIVYNTSYNKAILIYNNIVDMLKRESTYDKDIKISLMTVIDLNNYKQDICQYEFHKRTMQIIVNDCYVVNSYSPEEYEYNCALISTAYERRLIHGTNILL